MKITPENYSEAIDKIGAENLIPELKEYHRIITNDFPDMEVFKENFNEFEDIKADFQEYFDTLENMYADKLSGKQKRNQITEKTQDALKKNREKRETQKKTTDVATEKEPEKKVRTSTKKANTPTETKSEKKAKTSEKKDCKCTEKELEKQKKAAEREKAKKQEQKEKEKKAAEKEKEKQKGKDAPKGTVHKVLPEVQRIKRFLTLCNARNGAKSSEIVALYRALEIDATTQTIRKTSPYAAEITEIANDLLYIINNSTTSTTKLNLSAERREKYEAIVKGKVVYWSVFFGNKILRMVENPKATREAAKKLQEQIDKKKTLIQKEPKINIEGFNALNAMLNRYVENGTKMSFQQLQLTGAGLNGVGNLGLTDFLSLISNTFGIATTMSKL